jgi:parallel beta-helix repeat protein
MPGATIWSVPVVQQQQQASIQTPGPSSALYNNPYYSCTTNKYVSTTGNDTAGTGSLAAPWLTLAKADASAPTAGTCINVEPGTYAAGLTITHGGNAASSTGYVVYRCTTLDGCTITDNGTNNNAAFDVQANYIQIDGFVMAASSSIDYGQGVEVFNGTNAFTFAQHHVWVINNIISGYGQAGAQLNEGEFFYVIHNTFHDNSTGAGCGGGAGGQSSAISLASEMPISSYTLTADDQNNSVTGNTGTLFRNFIMFNHIYNNRLVGCTVGEAQDGSAIILDTWNWNCDSTCTTGASPYTGGALLAFNVAYNNGGAGFALHNSEYATVANNSCYNNYLDTNNTARARGCIDTLNSYGDTVINNAIYAICGSGVLAYNSGMGAYGPFSGPITTTLSGGISAGATSVTLASTSFVPGGEGLFLTAGSGYQLPGGNMIQIDSEVMLVTAGWGTTTLTVQRGYNGTTAASHANSATVTWSPEYFSNNISFSSGTCSKSDVDLGANGDFYSSAQNKEATDSKWVNVGNTSAGSMSTPPNRNNFALQSTSPAIGYGLTSLLGQTFLPSQSVDGGACYHTLGTCP